MRNILLHLSLFLTITLVAQNYTVSGYVLDLNSGESMIGATVYDSISQRGVVTNAYGFYSLSLPKGRAKIFYSFVGYQGQNRDLVLHKDSVIKIELTETVELQEVIVVANKSETGVMGSQMSAIDVPIEQIKNVPSMMGEVDVVKALQLLPGVQSGNDAGSGFYVRGGGPDENLMLLDGVPLYNVNHLFGFFSVFNADAVKNVTLYKGSFPARYGGRLSSVVDVRTKEGNLKEYHGNVSIGLLSAKVMAEGPIWKDKTAFIFSARRTYFDVLAMPFMPLINESYKQGDRTGYYFYDINAKVHHKFSDKDKIYLSFYMGDDVMYASMNSSFSNTSDASYTTNIDSKTKMDWAWGNLITSLRWSHVYGSKLFSNASLTYSQYNFNVDTKLGTETKNYPVSNPDFVQSATSQTNVGYKSKIQDIAFRGDYDWMPHHNHDIKFGEYLVFHVFSPGVSVFQSESASASVSQAVDTLISDPSIYALESHLYFEDNITLTKNLKMNVGLNLSTFSVRNNIYWGLEPRLSFRALVTKDLSFKASYSYMSQYIHLLTNSSVSLPADLWVPVTDNIKPMRSHQAALGVFYNVLGELDLSVEGYYKSMDNVLEYQEGASFLGSTTSWEDKVYQGRGWSYGVEFLAQRSVGKLTGWIGYTWSKSERLFDREGQVLNEGKPFYAKYDRRHDFSVTLNYAFNKKIDVSATYVYGTGTCGSLPMQTYQAPVLISTSTDINNLYGVPDGLENGTIDYIPVRNNYRLPDYHRLDLGVNFHKKLKRFGSQTWSVGIYNVYNQLNPFMVYNSYENNKKVLKMMSIFPVMPSVSYTFKF